MELSEDGAYDRESGEDGGRDQPITADSYVEGSCFVISIYLQNVN